MLQLCGQKWLLASALDTVPEVRDEVYVGTGYSVSEIEIPERQF